MKSVRVFHSVNQSIPTGVITYLSFDSERWDDGDFHDVDTNNSRLTAPVAGCYLITANLQFAVHAAGMRQIDIIVNRATYIGRVLVLPAGGSASVFAVSTLYKLAAGEYVEVGALQSSGGALNVEKTVQPISPEFSMTQVDP